MHPSSRGPAANFDQDGDFGESFDNDQRPNWGQQGQSMGGPGYNGHQKTVQEEVKQIEFICDDGQPLQFIKYDKSTGKFTVEPEAVQVLLDTPGNVGFCSLAGKYRTGKSFLLNQLLCLKGQGVVYCDD